MRHSLGVVIVRDPDDVDGFRYDIHKAVDLNYNHLSSFLEGAMLDDVERVIIHGRLATQGDVNLRNAHPLEIECAECDIDYVIHNGVMSRYERMQREFEDNGHHFTTDVDSEVIAHSFEEVPTDMDEVNLQQHGYQPAFLLLNENAIYIRSSRYQLSEDGQMSKDYREFGPDVAGSENYDAVIMTPNQDA